ncbi:MULTISPECIES: FAD-dependent oxidoreductase [unclassified Geodermatophilus]
MALLSTATLEFVRRTDTEGGVTAFAFAPVEPLNHLAGHHAFLSLPDGGTKPFSLASAPEDPQVLIGTRLASGSRFKRALTGLSPGDRVRLRRPLQRSALADTADDVVLLAQGVGVTPHRALLRHLAATGARRRGTLVHVGRDHPFRADTEELAHAAVYPGDRAAFGRELERLTTDLPGATYHVSGSPAFVRDTTAALSAAGIPRRQVRREAFRGY